MNKNWLVACATDWVILYIGIALSYLSPWFIPLSILIIGNRQHALAILGHDGAHRLAAKNKTLNDAMTNWLVFYPMGLCLEHYRKFHWDHHRYVGTDRDPEMPLKEIGPFKLAGEFSKKKLFLATFCDLIGLGAPQLAAFLIHVRARSWRDLMPLCFVATTTLLLIYSGLWLAVVLWFVSLSTSFWAFFRLRVWSEHVGGKAGETLVFDPNWFQKALFLPHNTWLHHEHHAHPGVPFNELPSKREGQIGEDLCESRLNNKFAVSKVVKAVT